MVLGKYSFGIGDRFGKEGKAQLKAFLDAKKTGINVTPVWNKSHREHTIIGTSPKDVRKEADNAVHSLKWQDTYYVDADHINLNNVELFIEPSDFFTIDVADFIGQPADENGVQIFVNKHKKYIGSVKVPCLDVPLNVTAECIESTARRFLRAVGQAGEIYRHIASTKGTNNFVTEISMDETVQAQSPVELFVILAAVAQEGIPAQTIAPKFSGRFNKGVDYAGDVSLFAKEFEQDLVVLSFAVKEFGLPENLKLSVHSGSDKFLLYKPINKAIRKFDAGIHIKTAGTTWLEEVIGLAVAGGKGLDIAKKIYAKAFSRYGELCGPYATVIDIDKNRLPPVLMVKNWSSEDYVNALHHDESCDAYNPDFRQLLHIAYKVAAELGDEYLDALQEHRQIVERNVTQNIFERHIKPIFTD